VFDEHDFLRVAQKSMHRKQWASLFHVDGRIERVVCHLLRTENLIFAGASLEIALSRFKFCRRNIYTGSLRKTCDLQVMSLTSSRAALSDRHHISETGAPIVYLPASGELAASSVTTRAIGWFLYTTQPNLLALIYRCIPCAFCKFPVSMAWISHDRAQVDP
jgi:hypothetical protein